MGFMGMKCLCDSDRAADLAYHLGDHLAEGLKKGLEEKANDWNTDGPVNVALAFEGLILPCKCSSYIYNDKLRGVAKTCLKELKKRQTQTEWKQWHKSLRRMACSLETFLNGGDD